jgi:Arc/MetJ-type ribon-helix-helix transcriptional regulator
MSKQINPPGKLQGITEKRKYVTIAAKIPEEVYTQLQEYLQRHPEYVSVSEVVRHMIVKALKEEK